jgi:hypothetical protein
LDERIQCARSQDPSCQQEKGEISSHPDASQGQLDGSHLEEEYLVILEKQRMLISRRRSDLIVSVASAERQTLDDAELATAANYRTIKRAVAEIGGRFRRG